MAAFFLVSSARVLGGGGGLGAAIATALHAEGARLAIADISGDAAEAARDRLGGETLALTWDLADLERIGGHVDRIEQTLGSVDILVNITGGPPPTPVSGQGADVWDKHFRAMVLSVVAITDRVLPGMKAKNGAASSPAPRPAWSRPSPISASRMRCA